MSQRFQLRPQLHIIENFTIKHNPNRAILIADGLLPAAQINNTEPGIAQANPIGIILKQVNAKLVWPTMTDTTQHRSNLRLFNRMLLGSI
jgi:hypothetical protein